MFMMESLLVVFMFFFIANLVLVIWSLIDAIKVPDDSMFKAGTKLIWVLGDRLHGLHRVDHLSRGRATFARRPNSRAPFDGSEPAAAPSACCPRLTIHAGPGAPTLSV